jgi:type II secretory pathway component PulJ
MRLIRDQRGFTAIELLVASSMFIVVLCAALAPLQDMWKISRQDERMNATQDLTRRTIDYMAGDLRNAGGQASPIELAGTSDIVFTSVDPLTTPQGSNASNLKRVRYCLNGTTLLRQEQTWSTAAPPAVPSTSACPGLSPWSQYTPIATSVANGSAKAIFTYDTATLAQVASVGLDLILDPAPGQHPTLKTELTSLVSLRNRVGQ